MQQTRRRPYEGPPWFEREARMNRMTARTAEVVEVSRPAEGVVRVSVSGPDFADFSSTGPGDHVRLFFPDPVSAVLVAPTPTADGIQRPTGPAISRDYTPLNMRDGEHGVIVDLDFMLHANAGPATEWADAAAIGDRIVMVGPRGSRQAPSGIGGLLLIVDETALPSAGRWLQAVSRETPVTLVAPIERDADWIMDYLGIQRDRPISVRAVALGADTLMQELRSLGPIDERTFIFAAGEATALTEVRRYLLKELGLPSAQLAISGYWRRGEVAFDHHSPLGED